jgi:hypothetical protein
MGTHAHFLTSNRTLILDRLFPIRQLTATPCLTVTVFDTTGNPT